MSEVSGTLIERERFALVVIDVQERLAAAMDARDEVIRATSRLVRAAAMLRAPIIVTRQYPQGLGPTVPEMEELILGLAEEGAKVQGVDKTAFCCAAEIDFREALRATGRRQVVLAGMETHICVAQTALALSGDGYDVHVPGDACCSRDVRNHELALDRMRHGGITVTTSESVMYEAVGRAGTAEFKQLLAIVKE